MKRIMMVIALLGLMFMLAPGAMADTPTITPTSTPTSTATPQGPGNIVVTPTSFDLGGQTVTMKMFYSNTNANDMVGGGVFITVPTGWPAIDLTKCVITLSNPAATPTVVANGKTVSITAASLMGRFGTILYEQAMVIPTVVTYTASTTFNITSRAKTLSAQLPGPINTVSLIVYAPTATVTSSATAIPTATATPNASSLKTITSAVKISGPGYIKSVTIFSRILGGSLKLSNASTLAEIQTYGTYFELSPTAVELADGEQTYNFTPAVSEGGVYFSRGVYAWTITTTASADNNTFTAYFRK